MDKAETLLVNRQDLSDIRFSKEELPSEDVLESGEVLLTIDHFSFTSNNITYAATGDELHYWNFFPAEEGWGKVPCWGFGTVVSSRHPEIPVGERYYGYYPIASHLTVSAERVHPSGFYDGATHRKPLPSVYNHYHRTAADPTYSPAFEDRHMIFQPLFATSFLLEDHLAEEAFFGAQRLVLTSASSKTAIALAFLLKDRKQRENQAFTITGLTSAGNREFVESLGYYDEVLTYDELQALENGAATTIVDFAGNKQLLLDLQVVLGDTLKFISFIGIAHREQRSAAGRLTGNSAFFFAPTQAKKRAADWGPEGLQRRMTEQWFPFLKASEMWLHIVRGGGADDLRVVYLDMLKGRVDPSEGHVLSLSGA